MAYYGLLVIGTAVAFFRLLRFREAHASRHPPLSGPLLPPCWQETAGQEQIDCTKCELPPPTVWPSLV